MGQSEILFPLILAVVSGFHGYFKWDEVPTTSVPVWWDIDSLPVYYLPKWFGFSILPVLMFLIPVAYHQLIACDRSVDLHAGESKHALHHLIVLPGLFLFVVYNFVLLGAYVTPSEGYHMHTRFLVASVAIWLMIWAGYNLQHIALNHTVGILTPWTLYSQSAWKKTHAHAAQILIPFGLVLLICAFTVKTGVPLLVVTLVLWLGSYIYLFFYSAFVSTPSGEGSAPLLPS